jgi:arylsulfatase
MKKKALSTLLVLAIGIASLAQTGKKPNILILMTDDTGWGDFGYMSGGGTALGHPTPNIDRLAKEGAIFTSWYGQASCTAGRCSFITGRIPIRSALSVVVAPVINGLMKQTLTIAEFFKKNGWHNLFLRQMVSGRSAEILPHRNGLMR